MQLKLLILTVFGFLAQNEAKSYLTERPAFLKTCLLSDSNFGKCYASNLQVLFQEWVNGVPGLKTVGSLDPLDVKRVKLSQQGNNAVSVNAILQNVVIKGLKSGVVKDARVNPKNNNVDVKVFLPKQRYDFEYKAKGRVLTLPINGEGKGFFELENVVMSVHATTKLRSEGDNVFMDIQSMKLHIDSIDGFHVHLGNLFGGQKDLEDSANALFNESWRSIFDVISPAIEQIIEAVLEDRFKKIFEYVPSNYFISDLPHI